MMMMMMMMMSLYSSDKNTYLMLKKKRNIKVFKSLNIIYSKLYLKINVLKKLLLKRSVLFDV